MTRVSRVTASGQKICGLHDIHLSDGLPDGSNKPACQILDEKVKCSTFNFFCCYRENILM